MCSEASTSLGFVKRLSSSLGKVIFRVAYVEAFPKRSSAQDARAHGFRQVCSDPAEEQPGCFSCFCGLFSSRSDVERSVSHVNNASTKSVRLGEARKHKEAYVPSISVLVAPHTRPAGPVAECADFVHIRNDRTAKRHRRVVQSGFFFSGRCFLQALFTRSIAAA